MNDGCNQGGSCPARVARVGAKSTAGEFLTKPAWRDKMAGAALGALIVFALLMIVSMFAMVLR